MLQQTQVATVIPYYERFLERFPDLASLASASGDDVLALWSGLGYYARGRNLHKAARAIRDDHAGQFPDELETVMQLPGIGRSTAAAILALTWNQRQTILDGNVKRVLTRYHAISGWPGTRIVEQQLWRLADVHTPAIRCADYTQAIMDLGATVCRRSKPQCDRCPLQQECQAYQHNTVSAYPSPRPKKARPHKHTNMLVITRESGEILLEKRPPIGIWGGLWCLPELTSLPTALSDWGLQYCGIKISQSQQLAAVEHSFSHFDLTITPLVCRATTAGERVMDNPDQLWYNPGPAATVGMAAAVKKIIHAYLQSEERPLP